MKCTEIIHPLCNDYDFFKEKSVHAGDQVPEVYVAMLALKAKKTGELAVGQQTVEVQEVDLPTAQGIYAVHLALVGEEYGYTTIYAATFSGAEWLYSQSLLPVPCEYTVRGAYLRSFDHETDGHLISTNAA